jgi:hypothetical protein
VGALERLRDLAERQIRAVAGRSRFAARYSVELAEHAHRLALAALGTAEQKELAG